MADPLLDCIFETQLNFSSNQILIAIKGLERINVYNSAKGRTTMQLIDAILTVHYYPVWLLEQLKLLQPGKYFMTVI